jgi:transposase
MEDKIMKPYPLELRLRVVAAYEEGQGTIAEIAALFHVGVTFIKKMIGRSRNGESLEPKHGGGAKPSLNEVNLEVLRAAVETHPDATLGELKWFLRTDRGIKVSLATICRALQKLKLGRKKRASSPVNATTASVRLFAARSPIGMCIGSSSLTRWART